MDPAVMNNLFPRRRSLLERLAHNQMEALMFIASGYADSAIATELLIDTDQVVPLLQTIYSDLHIDESGAVDQRCSGDTRLPSGNRSGQLIATVVCVALGACGGAAGRCATNWPAECDLQLIAKTFSSHFLDRNHIFVF